MSTAIPDELLDLRRALRELCSRFPGEYWRSLEPDGYPEKFVHALTEQGWLAALIHGNTTTTDDPTLGKRSMFCAGRRPLKHSVSSFPARRANALRAEQPRLRQLFANVTRGAACERAKRRK